MVERRGHYSGGVAHLIEEIKRQLRLQGSAQNVVESDEQADEWRTAARAAARELGRPVETVQSEQVVAASLKDWPANELEAEVHRARLHKAIASLPWLPSPRGDSNARPTD